MNEKEQQIKTAVRGMIADAGKWTPDEKTKILEIRTGEAEKISYPVKLNVQGTIGAAFEFYRKRVTKPFGTEGKPEDSLHDRNKMHLVVNRDKGTIVIVIDENNEKGTVIGGSIQKNPFLEVFGINSDNLLDNEDMAKLIKKNRMWFADPKQCGDMVHNLQHFTAKWDTEIRRVDNARGITVNSIARELKTEVPLNFILQIAPLKGFPPQKFIVDIGVQVDGNSVEFYLESIELMEIQLKLTVEEVEKQIGLFNDEIAIFEV